MAKTIAVVGVTGAQGGSVADKFLSLGWNVRGITRSAMSDSAKAKAAEGISIVEADLDNLGTLIPAFRGAHVIFAITDFWAPFWEANARLSKISDRATGEHAYAIEVQRGRNVVDAVQQVSKEDGMLERFIFSTLPSFKEQSNGKYTYVYHFDSKADVTEYLKSKEDLWQKSSLLNMAFYSKDTGRFADLLVRCPPKQDLLAVSEMASYRTVMNIWSKTTGIPAEAQEISVEEADKDAPGGFGRESGESAATSAEFGWGDHLVLPKDLDPEIRTTSLKEYMENQKR
ncbi:hypothetical protein OIDMADRAFT_101134 [Oidiodendron maius Zn]|uniref:NmrA-like domain-containing protein n=1 Tax=Oidiodendron maius (strain Zn) TaxID=913774 RepID=A0A0C3HDT3_OIDMZ|nr:hypothetical protein OIDMADRAFT_101134 [Oidiodendron maius Zn]